jgi:predicted enzyme related to lactoylglutathione lyase
MQFRSLDFVYTPSRDVARDLAHFTGALGAEQVFAIEAFGTRVAMVRLSDEGPGVLLAGHLEGETPVLVYRVDDLDAALARLEQSGAEIEARFEIPHGPCAALALPGGQRIALYELTRPEADERLGGRRDFEAG